MTVGFSSVGKTTLLDCLFPIKGYFQQQEGRIIKKDRKAHFFALQGNQLMKFKDQESYLCYTQTMEPHEVIELTNQDWGIEESNQRGLFGITITPRKKSKQRHTIELFTGDSGQRDAWLERLKRVCFNQSTHGIAIDNPEVNDHPLVAQYTREKGGGERLELSVWDFAGQNEYYNNHHFFLSIRTVFLILYRLDQGKEGLEGLSFWLRSLSAYLDPSSYNQDFSIIIVGTFLDKPSVRKEDWEQRSKKVKELCSQNRMEVDFQYYEVSCLTLENVHLVETAMYTSVFQHSYMGKMVPASYLAVEKAVKETRREKAIPMQEIKKISSDYRIQIETVKRALSLLSLWGECVYFDEPKELAETVILDPKFLTQGILAGLFQQDLSIQNKKKGGVIRHSDLLSFWSKFKEQGEIDSFLPTFVALLQKVGVLFTMEADHDLPFLEQRSIIPCLLPIKPEEYQLESFERAWPKDPPFSRPIEVERILKFNVLPVELVSRLLVLLHPHIQDNLVWKNEVVIFKKSENTQGWIRAEVELNRFIVTLRGSDLSHCKELLKWIFLKIKEVGQKQLSMKYEEKFRSPHYHQCEIEEKVVMEDAQRKREDRKLVCPVTGFPINSEELLERAGMKEPPSLMEKGMLIFSKILDSHKNDLKKKKKKMEYRAQMVENSKKQQTPFCN